MSHRQPIVAILGHVDHGKTTLLDYIRQSHRAAGEAGGITQGIGAYQAQFQGQKITFIDTPGHAAFRTMRSRGVTVADLVVLVIAADDGVKPQTLESIKLIKDSGLPFIVALNKADKPGVVLDQVKAELTQAEVFVEGYGGNTPVVTLSGKTGQGVEALLENILLLSELEELPLEPDAPLSAPVIESGKDGRIGVTASVIVKSGTLKVGAPLYTVSASGKVRSLYNDLGQSIPSVLPGEPARIVGFTSLPKVGEVVTSAPVPADDSPKPEADQALAETGQPTGQLNIILRADSVGALEAVQSNLAPEVNVIAASPGDFTESDVLLARGGRALILGFGVKIPGSVLKLSQLESVTVKSFPVIYELLEYLEKKVLRLLEPTIDEEELGRATILKIFTINHDKIAGCRVDSGVISVGDSVHVNRGDLTKSARIRSMRVGKQEVKKLEAGTECGILFSTNLDIESKDVIIAYKKIHTDEE